MAWLYITVAVVIAVGVLVAVFASGSFGSRRGRHVHRGGTVHWYPNYDEDLRYEPLNESDIVAISRGDLVAFGYSSSSEEHVVPRTFRGRIPGDHRLRLWTSVNRDLRPIWVCVSPNIPELLASDVATIALSNELLALSLEARKNSDELNVVAPDIVSLGAWNEDDGNEAVESELLELELDHEPHRLGCPELPQKVPLSNAPDIRPDPVPSAHEPAGTVRARRGRAKRKRKRSKRQPPRPEF